MSNKNYLDVIEYINIANYNEKDESILPISINSSDIKNSNDYIVYKEIPINEIEILITNARRIDEEAKKIQELNTISYYLDKNNKEEYSILQNVLNTTSISSIEELETIQNNVEKSKPNTVKYNKDYLWQVYYISKLNKYCMIVPIQETEQQAFLYLLKKKIENSNRTIYVPICNGTYENFLLEYGKIKKIENILYSLTNKWPVVYQTVNKQGETFATIIGKVVVLENITSDYKMEFLQNQSMLDFYNLLTTLFYLHTELNNYFVFDILLDNKAMLHFYFNNFELTNSSLNEFYKTEINYNLKNIETLENIQVDLKNKLKKLLDKEEKLKEDLSYKQKQISTFLECKKTVIGRFKYFFKLKKKSKEQSATELSNLEVLVEDTKKTEYNLYNYNIEDLIYICKELRKKKGENSNLEMDINSALTRTDILSKKIENANSYLKEIDSHKKSIFEFWKYTNKDEKKQLEEANVINENKKNSIIKNFSIKEDFKTFAKKIDLNQRKQLTEEELNGIFLTTTEVLEDINNVFNKTDIDTTIFESLNKEEETYNSITEHRETPRNKKGILNLIQTNTFDEYKKQLQEYTKKIESALEKCLTDVNVKAYSAIEPKKQLCVLDLNPTIIIKDNLAINLYRINIKKGTPTIAFSNCIFFSNRNNTLPLGMDYSTKLLIDLKNYDIEKVQERTNYIIKLSKNSVQQINIIDFNI